MAPDIIRGKWFIIDGINPEPWTAPEASVGYKNGGHYVQMHKTEGLRAYQEAVPDVLREQNPDLHSWGDEPVDLHFYFWRRLDSYDLGDGERSRRNYADATNMQKALEDALQGILFENDRKVRCITSQIMDQGHDVEPRILIHVASAWDAPQWVQDRADQMVARLPKREAKSNILPADDLF